MHLVTARLLLRDYSPDDLPALAACQADPRMREFYGPDEGGPEQARELLDLFLAWATERPRRNHQLAIALREAPATVVGSVGLRQAGAPPASAELGLELVPELWGRGYAAEAARALIAFGFVRLELQAIGGSTISANERVTRLMRALGFRAAATDAGIEWMQARGWHRVEWRLTRAEWDAAPR